MRWFPHAPSVHCQLGFLYDAIGVSDLSVFHSEKAICLLRKNDKWFAPYMNLGIGFIHLNIPKAAVSAFDMAESLKDKAGMVEYGKLLIFRAEARRDIIRKYGMNDEIYNNALTDLAQGEHVFRACNLKNETAKFWLKQVPERRRELEAMAKV